MYKKQERGKNLDVESSIVFKNILLTIDKLLSAAVRTMFARIVLQSRESAEDASITIK